MAQLIVRNLEDDLVRRLKRRAGEHGLSMEEEHRMILREALSPKDTAPSFWEHLSQFPDVGDDSIFARDRALPDRASDQGVIASE